MIHEPVSVILNPYEILEAEGEPAPRMGLEFWQVNQEIRFNNRLWEKHVFPEIFFSF